MKFQIFIFITLGQFNSSYFIVNGNIFIINCHFLTIEVHLLGKSIFQGIDSVLIISSKKGPGILTGECFTICCSKNDPFFSLIVIKIKSGTAVSSCHFIIKSTCIIRG